MSLNFNPPNSMRKTPNMQGFNQTPNSMCNTPNMQGFNQTPNSIWNTPNMQGFNQTPNSIWNTPNMQGFNQTPNSIWDTPNMQGFNQTPGADMYNMPQNNFPAFDRDFGREPMDIFEKSKDNPNELRTEERQEPQEFQEQMETLDGVIEQLGQQIASMPDSGNKTEMLEDLSKIQEQLGQLLSGAGGDSLSTPSSASSTPSSASSTPSSASSTPTSASSTPTTASSTPTTASSTPSSASSTPSSASSTPTTASSTPSSASSTPTSASSNDISENSVMAKPKDSSQSWGDYWNSQGYNEEAGKTLSDKAYQTAHSENRCGSCVGNAINSVYGTELSGNGQDWDNNLRGQNQNFKEIDISNLSKEELIELVDNLPAGAVVSWDGFSGDTSSAFSKYGHVAVADGNGGENSDLHRDSICNYAKKENFTKDKCAIFIPV